MSNVFFPSISVFSSLNYSEWVWQHWLIQLTIWEEIEYVVSTINMHLNEKKT